jgi:hypothetical protein
MSIAEPITMLTDYALAAASALLAWRLFRALEGQASRRYWTVAFFALALAALSGGSYHGLAPMLSESLHGLLWKTTILSVGIASFSMLAGSAIAVTAGHLRKLLIIFATAKLALYSIWMFAHDAFIYVIVDSGLAMVMVAALHGWSGMRRRDGASRWMLGAVLVSVLAAGVQASGFAVHEHSTTICTMSSRSRRWRSSSWEHGNCATSERERQNKARPVACAVRTVIMRLGMGRENTACSVR